MRIMKTSKKYVVFYCDQCDLLEGVIAQMIMMYPDLEVRTLSNIETLLKNVEDKLPQVIMVYLTINDERISVVKRLREFGDANETPVVIFKSLPDEVELKKFSDRF